MTVVLIGPPGSGKTKLGKRVARALGLPLIDTDRTIVAQHGAIVQIFADHGEPHFRDLERSAVMDALKHDAIVSLGGGAILHPDTQADLAHHRVALITVSAAAVASRIGGAKRPLVGNLADWVALVDSRKEIYARLADRTWDTSARPLDGIAREIAQWAVESQDEGGESDHD